ncbi:MAG TPA: NAD(+)/NADH kinase [Solirubrobacteraceae bacterium]|jgi:NAD+ kinase|nr:NAD(+)/NADH kinase [Solirubrobacteraceae bacterium]
MHRVGVVLHPTRPVGGAVETLTRWAAEHGVELVDVKTGDGRAGTAALPDLPACDLIAAVGGDGTVLTALHAAAKTDTPVLGVACGSLGALSAVPASELSAALDKIAAGEWWPRRLPGLVAQTVEGPVGPAINDLVLVRRAGSQLVIRVSVGDDLYARLAGDGLVVATPLGSSAYSMAAGGSLLLMTTRAFVCTPLAMHGGCAPPLVVPGGDTVVLEADPGHGGFDLEVDGHRMESSATRFEVTMQDDYASLVGLGQPDSGLPGLRRRGLITDSPRVLARDARTASEALEGTGD